MSTATTSISWGRHPACEKQNSSAGTRKPTWPRRSARAAEATTVRPVAQGDGGGAGGRLDGDDPHPATSSSGRSCHEPRRYQT